MCFFARPNQIINPGYFRRECLIILNKPFVLTTLNCSKHFSKPFSTFQSVRNSSLTADLLRTRQTGQKLFGNKKSDFQLEITSRRFFLLIFSQSTWQMKVRSFLQISITFSHSKLYRGRSYPLFYFSSPICFQFSLLTKVLIFGFLTKWNSSTSLKRLFFLCYGTFFRCLCNMLGAQQQQLNPCKKHNALMP